MAEIGPELEDGESYLPSGILLGEDGWAAGGGNSEHHLQLQQRQSFFSDGVGGLPCYPPEVARAAMELSPYAMAVKGGKRVGYAQNQRPCGSFPASRLHFQEGFEMSCLYSAVAPEAAPRFGRAVSGASPALGRVVLSPGGGVYTLGSGLVYPFHPVKPGYAQAENCAKMAQRQTSVRFSSGKVPGYGGTGVFLPLPRHQNEPWKSRGKGGDGAAAHRQQQESNQKPAAAGVAKQLGMPSFHGRREMVLPQDWNY